MHCTASPPAYRAAPPVTWQFLAGAALVFLLGMAASHAEHVAGTATVIDGDSLRIGATEIRLFGIDAPEGRQACQRDDRPWACGRAARDALASLVAHATTRCDWHALDDYGRALATCFVAAKELNGTLVERGLALAYRRYSTQYVAHEERARSARRGVWATRFEAPWKWRQAHAATRRQANGDCTVKGNVNRKGERIYHDRHSHSYDAVRIHADEGDRCFDDVSAARAAGFRPPRR